MKKTSTLYDSAPRLSKRNLWTFSLGTIGRDMACTGLFTGNILNYIYFTKHLTAAQLTVLTVLMVAAKVFDAFNDPVMGNIIDATHSKWGKFKPWILIGMLGSAAVIVLSFCNNLQGWGYVAFFGIMYFIYSIVFTMNDISYWGMIPALARHPADRDRLSSFTAFCANIGGGICGILIPILTTGQLALNGSAVSAYMLTSVIFVILFIMFQSITLAGVKQPPEDKHSITEKVSLKQIINVFKTNDQLRWITIVYVFTQLLPNAAYTMYIYFKFGYNGTLLTLFYVFSSIASVAVNLFYPKMSKNMSRTQLLRLSTIFMIAGNLLVLAFGLFMPQNSWSVTVPFFNAQITIQFLLIAASYFFCGFANTCFYMVLMICVANTTEYNDLLTGERNEGIIFSVRAFLYKFGNAVSTLVIMLFYVVIGVNKETDGIADLEQAANMGTINGEQKLSKINDLIMQIPAGKTNAILLLVTVTPIVLYTISFLIYRKHYKITEEYFDEITSKLEERNAAEQEAMAKIEEASASEVIDQK